MNTAQVKVGRLLEIRVASGLRTSADVDAHFVSIAEALQAIPKGQQHVTVADWRSCPVMSQEAAQSFARQIAQHNARTERSAALANQEAPVTVLQFMRVIREAGLPDRKLFFNAEELQTWVGEILSEAEQERLREFLAGS